MKRVVGKTLTPQFYNFKINLEEPGKSFLGYKLLVLTDQEWDFKTVLDFKISSAERCRTLRLVPRKDVGL